MKKNIYIKTSFRLLTLLLMSLILLSSCAKDPAPVLYDVYKDKGTATPSVTGISPADSAWAGYDVITITGQNFLTATDSAMVYFDGVLASLVDINPTQIRVKAPNLPKDNILIRVFTRTSDATSQPLKYKLKEIMRVVRNYTFQEEPRTITFDRDGNLFVSMTTSGSGIGVKKIDKTGNQTDFAPKGSETFWTGMKWAYGTNYGGANGTLIAARSQRALFKVSPGATSTVFAQIASSFGVAFNDIDLDPNGNIWAAGSGKYLVKFKPTDLANPVAYANFAQTSSIINAVRIYKDTQNNLYVYVAGTKDNKEGVWRYKLDANQEINTAQGELMVDFSAKYPGNKIKGLTFSEDGDMYIGTDGSDVILVAKDANNIQPLLPGVLLPKFISMSFGINEPYLYYSREKLSTETVDKDVIQKLFRVYVFKNGAPYYGLSL